MRKQKKTVNTTLQNELSTLKAFGDWKNEHESEIQKQRREMNKKHQVEIKQKFIETR